MKKTQIMGFVIILLSCIAYFLVDNGFIQTIAGILCAVGVGLIFNWLSFKEA